MAKTTKKTAPATTKKAAATTKKTSNNKRESLVVGSKTKEALKGTGANTLNVSSETLEAVNEYLYWLIDQARKRCVANGRKTIRPHDIIAS